MIWVVGKFQEQKFLVTFSSTTNDWEKERPGVNIWMNFGISILHFVTNKTN